MHLQPLKHEPCGVLADADLLGKLKATDALPRRDKQVHRMDPLVQRNVRPAKDCPGADGEIEVAGVAVVEADALASADPIRFAIGTYRAIGPQPAFEIDPRGIVRRERLEQLKSADAALAHVSIVAEYRAVVNYTHVYNSLFLSYSGHQERRQAMGTITLTPYAFYTTICGTHRISS